MSSKQALVFGASGVSGWAITRECLIYPSPSTFERVVAITKRPLEKSEFMVPDDQLTRLELASDVDLTAGIEAVTARLRQIPGIESITHVFFTGKLFQDVMKQMFARLDTYWFGEYSIWRPWPIMGGRQRTERFDAAQRCNSSAITLPFCRLVDASNWRQSVWRRILDATRLQVRTCASGRVTRSHTRSMGREDLLLRASECSRRACLGCKRQEAMACG